VASLSARKGPTCSRAPAAELQRLRDCLSGNCTVCVRNAIAQVECDLAATNLPSKSPLFVYRTSPYICDRGLAPTAGMHTQIMMKATGDLPAMMKTYRS
jgi:hypothetical protein